ncbi:MAG TPA: HAD family hydrolase [Mycobacteriales bacterium]|nr:HAD family hydrolase [Mycobacteriales bacterium]
MTPAVVATDLDGTIVRTDGRVSARTKAALAAATDAGALLVIATGRPPRWLPEIAEAAGHDGLAICANGALVFDLATDQVIESHPLAVADVRRLMTELRAAIPGITFALERVDGQFAHELNYHLRWDPEPGTIVGDFDDALFSEPISKLLGRREGMDVDDLLAVARSVVEGSAANLTHSSIDGLLEVSAPGVTKASTLAGLLAARGLTAADVIAFGDMPNDLEMLVWAGHGVAVANAHPDVLAVVDEVTATNDDDGVAKVLERFYPT